MSSGTGHGGEGTVGSVGKKTKTCCARGWGYGGVMHGGVSTMYRGDKDTVLGDTDNV